MVKRQNQETIMNQETTVLVCKCSKDFPEVARAEVIAFFGNGRRVRGNPSLIMVKVDSFSSEMSNAWHFAFVREIHERGRKIWENKEKFGNRRMHLNPAPHPSSLNPKLARAMVNIARGDKIPKTMLDPFCGAGGILIEMGLMNMIPVGYDIDPLMVRRAEKNVKHYKIKNTVLSCGDALLPSMSFDHVVTDLPYRKNTKTLQSPQMILNGFIRILPSICKKRAVIGCDASLSVPRMPSGWRRILNLKIPLHKSLQKRILVLEKQE